ncbi:hypothetical protein FHS10_001722 [Mucilaginibacter dorajii]|nr:hypothetical protein [Mucilaginibacter dorajii]MCS3733779.1 hypothetical protein [Mucilaginibacter dorajii]
MKSLTKSFKAVLYGDADPVQLRNVSLAIIIPVLIILFIFGSHIKGINSI